MSNSDMGGACGENGQRPSNKEPQEYMKWRHIKTEMEETLPINKNIEWLEDRKIIDVVA